jgi:hypothetical protein
MFHVPNTLLPSLTLFWDFILSFHPLVILQNNMFPAFFLAINVFLTVVFWKSADLAWEDGRTRDAYLHLFFSALSGALFLKEIL